MSAVHATFLQNSEDQAQVAAFVQQNPWGYRVPSRCDACDTYNQLRVAETNGTFGVAYRYAYWCPDCGAAALVERDAQAAN